MIAFFEFSNIDVPLLLGLLASLLHVWTGPDHLAAVTPLVFETDKKHWKIGAFWGVGHLTGMLLIGLLYVLFKEYIPVEAISEHSEQLVGVILIGLGLWAFYKIKKDKYSHTHPHIHEENDNSYAHVHKHGHQHQPHSDVHQHHHKDKQNHWAATGVGILHGFAGISHFLLMLPALALETKWQSFQYLLGFAIGTIMAMVIFSFIIGKFRTQNNTKDTTRIYKNLRFWGGVVAIVVGVFWIIKNFI